MSEPNPFPSIPVTASQIIQQIGGRTFQRAQRYARSGQVVRYSYDCATGELHGLVNGSEQTPYEVRVHFAAQKTPGSTAFTAQCTCYVGTDCKHAAALMLTAIDRAHSAHKALNSSATTQHTAGTNKSKNPALDKLRTLGVKPASELTEPTSQDAHTTPKEPSRLPTWRRDLSHLLSAKNGTYGIDSARACGALDLSFSVAGARTWGHSTPRTPRINLLARPVMRSATGRWIKGGLSWETFASSTGGPTLRHDIYPEHERWFAEFYAVVRPWQSMYTSHRDWVSLTACTSTLLWDVLTRAQTLGLPILLEGQQLNLTVLPAASLKIHAAANTPNSDGLTLTAAIGWETTQNGRIQQLWLEAANCHPLGTATNTAGTGGTSCMGFFALGAAAQRTYAQAAEQMRQHTVQPGALDAVHRTEFAAPQQTPTPPSENTEPTKTKTGGRIQELTHTSSQNPDAQHTSAPPADLPDLPAGLELAFIPLTDPLDAHTSTLLTAGTIEIPAGERENFQRDYLPALARTVPAFTPDPALNLPRVRTPHLVFEIAFNEQVAHDAHTNWYWEYPANPLDTRQQADNHDSHEHETPTRLPVLGYPGEPHSNLRDARFEARILRQIHSLPRHPELTSGRTEGWETRELLATTVPALRRIPGVRIRLLGPVPAFREATDALIEVKVTEGNSHDWFGLAVAIRINDWHVPFAQVFEALDRAQDRILLGDGTYFSLNRPEFTALRALIAEARTLNDAGGELRINRRQVGLWQELESLASHVNTVAAWDEQVRGLLALIEDAAGQPETSRNTHNTITFTANLDAPHGLKTTLRPYQLEGFRWLAFLREHRLGGILADEMGLGKTVQALALLAHAINKHTATAHQHNTAQPEASSHPPFAPFLVVAPTSVVGNWEQEAARFIPAAKVVTITSTVAKSGKSMAELVADAHLVITSYALFRLDEAAYTEYGRNSQQPTGRHPSEHPVPGWGALILDEAQFVKNTSTRAWQAARNLPADFKLAITGTPLENNLMELWAILAIVADGLFPSARAFRDLYSRPAESGEDPQTVPRLRRRIGPLMLRRTKNLVAAELPNKNDERITVELSPTHRRIYDTRLQRERQKVLGLLKDMDKNRFTIFQSLTLLRRLALDASLIDPVEYAGVTSAKLEYLVEHLPPLIAGGHRVLVFSQFTGYLHSISERLHTEGVAHLYLDGATSNRPKVLRDFASGAAPVFLISLKAGGFGLNLTEADHCFIMDPWWNPAVEQQAVDRIHRIGQVRNVHVHRLVSAGTIEEKVMDLKQSKAALFDAVVNDGSFSSTTVNAEQIRELFAPAVER